MFPEDAQYPIDKISVAKVGNRIGIWFSANKKGTEISLYVPVFIIGSPKGI
jgi:hypothetical protein